MIRMTKFRMRVNMRMKEIRWYSIKATKVKEQKHSAKSQLKKKTNKKNRGLEH